jgi:phage terminase small subunit
MALNTRQKLFVEHYLKTNNATQAAIDAGYSPRTAGQIGHELLKKPEIASRVSKRTEAVLQAAQMSADEVLTRLTDIARGNIGVFLDGSGIDPFKAGKPTHLIKRIKTKRSEKFGDEIEVEMYDAQSALVTLGKHHKLFDRVAEGDWRDELLKAGVPETEVNRIFQEMVDTAARAIEHAKRS